MMFPFLLRFVGLGGEKDRDEEYSLFFRAASYSGSAVLKMSSLDELSDSLPMMDAGICLMMLSA